MPVGRAALLEIPLIAPGGDHGLIRDAHHAHAALSLRVPDAHPPGRAVRLGPHCLDAAAQVQQGGGDAVFLQQGGQRAPGIAFGHAAQVDLHAGGQGGGGALQSNLAIVHQGEQGGDGFIVWNGIRSRGEAPGPQDGVNGDVQRPVRAGAQAQRPVQQVRRRLGEQGPAIPVQGADLTVFIGDGPQDLELPHPALRPLQRLPVSALVQPQGHDGVHGKKGALRLRHRLSGRGCAARQQGQGHAEGERGLCVKRSSAHGRFAGMESSSSTHSRCTSTTR